MNRDRFCSPHPDHPGAWCGRVNTAARFGINCDECLLLAGHLSSNPRRREDQKRRLVRLKARIAQDHQVWLAVGERWTTTPEVAARLPLAPLTVRQRLRRLFLAGALQEKGTNPGSVWRWL